MSWIGVGGSPQALMARWTVVVQEREGRDSNPVIRENALLSADPPRWHSDRRREAGLPPSPSRREDGAIMASLLMAHV